MMLDNLYTVSDQALRYYRVRAFDSYPQFQHAIFTRKGGISPSPFFSLNLSTAVGDRPDIVQHNIETVCQALGIAAARTVSCHLVHGARVITVTAANRQIEMGQADGLITAEANTWLFMRFGDCTPLIFFDPVQKAVGLSHAGWRGTMQNAAGATVKAMGEQLGCKPKNMLAVIGPAIGPCCYEVGQDVIEAGQANLNNAANLFYKNGKPNHAHFDMWAANQQQLTEAGVTQVIQSGLCTACRTAEFFSHRAEQGQTGRFGVIVGMRA